MGILCRIHAAVRENETDATYPHFEVNYGVVPNVQLHLVAPLGYVHTIEGTHYGYSDTELGVKYRFVGETETMPQIGVFPLIEIPTGNENEQLGSGKIQVYVPAWVQKSWESSQRMEAAAFWYNPGAGKKNWAFTGWEAQYDFPKSIRSAENCFTRQPTVRIRNQETDLISAGSLISMN